MNVLYIIIIIAIIIILAIFILYPCRNYFSNVKKFKAPPSFTMIKAYDNFTSIPGTSTSLDKEELCKLFDKLCEHESEEKLKIKENNMISTPSFFNCNEKWPGCLPRPLYQGTCGSCWGFASVTCLSSRFYIESCGISGCRNYPQINVGSMNQIYENISANYRFNKVFLKSIVEYLDTNKDNKISKQEWLDVTEKRRESLFDKSINNYDKYMITQVLIYMLDFQSLGSIDLRSKSDVLERANKTFDIWINLINSESKDYIEISKLEESWLNQPISLSAEKLISCCINCIEIDFQQQSTHSKQLTINGVDIHNPSCIGGSLEDAWILLRDIGTTTSQCIGYNLDKYTEGESVPSCREVQGPFYSFCSGYMIDKRDSIKMRKKIEEIEKSGIFPVALPHDDDLPWTDPQLFRFRAKNAYKLPNDMKSIQKEIIERGPVTSGFSTYESFQYNFGSDGMGGQKYNKADFPLGSDAKSLIYMYNDSKNEKNLGGHAITIVGWGTYHHVDSNGKIYKIPYWVCLNSWGAEWGHSGFPEYSDRHGLPKNMNGGGYFWMIRSINNCEIEENVVVGQPDIENVTYPGVIDKYGWGLPGPLIDDGYFLNPLDVSKLEFGEEGYKLDIQRPIDGGGAYINLKDKEWQIKSMTPPSPYVLFWPTERPLFCIGNIENDIGPKVDDKIINISKETFNYLSKIKQIQPNPIMIINGEEQIQLMKLNDNNIEVRRAINYNSLTEHKKGAKLYVFPYQELNTTFLINNGFKQCNMNN